PVGQSEHQVEFGVVAGFPALILREKQRRFASFAKRLIDVLGASMGLLLLSPAFLILAMIVKLDSPGPVFYAHTRVGRRGRRFTCLKFRTMIPNANTLKSELRHLNELGNGFFFKIKDDPRLTRLGRYLRRYSIDEFPQLWNVLKG